MTIQSIADITGDGAAHRLSQTSKEARFVILTSIGGPSRLGGSNVAAAVGVSLPTGIPVTIPVNGADRTDTSDLHNIWAYIPNGSTLTIAYGV